MNQLLYRWKRLKRSRKVSLVMTLLLLIAGLSISIFSVLAYSSLQTLFSNIKIPSDIPEINLDFSHYSKIEETHIKIPYRISNKGFLDINRITLKISIDASYTENLAFTETRKTIFSKREVIGYCHPGESISGVFEGDYHDLNMTALGNYLSEVYKSKDEVFLMKLELNFYLVGGFYFRFILKDIDIEGGFCNECAG